MIFRSLVLMVDINWNRENTVEPGYGINRSKLGVSHPGALAKIDHAHQFHDVMEAKCTCNVYSFN